MYVLIKIGLWSSHTASNYVRQITCNSKYRIDLGKQTDITDLITWTLQPIYVKWRLIDLSM